MTDRGDTGLPDAAVGGVALMLQADHHLYAAKEQGRNRVVAGADSMLPRTTARMGEPA